MSLQGYIPLSDVLKIMAAPEPETGRFIPFSISFVTCNLAKDTGGERRSFENAVLAGAPFGKKQSARKANHFLNGTRNLLVEGHSRPITVHNLLITHFNGERVIIS